MAIKSLERFCDGYKKGEKMGEIFCCQWENEKKMNAKNSTKSKI